MFMSDFTRMYAYAPGVFLVFVEDRGGYWMEHGTGVTDSITMPCVARNRVQVLCESSQGY